jgi:hypothetical protein
LSWEGEIFSIPSRFKTEILWGSWLWLTLAVFNVPVLWNSTNISSIDDVVGVVVNGPWESLDGHHLIVRGIIETGLSLRVISLSEDDSSFFTLSGINSEFWIRSVINGPVSVVEEPLLILIVWLEMLDSEGSNTINIDVGQYEIEISRSLLVIGSKNEASMWLKSSSVWSSIDGSLINSVWRDIALKHFNFKFNVRPKWDLEIVNWGDSSSTTISVVSWAVKSSVITFVEFWEGNIKAVEGLS